MNTNLKPLGVFSAAGSQDYLDLGAPALIQLAGKIEKKNRTRIADYLRTASMIAPWMEITHDLIDAKFTVSGGSAIMSDGSFFWRLDTADYVEHHGTGLPQEFLTHIEALDSQPPALDNETTLRFERELDEFYKAVPDRELIRTT